jgi:hypothetical protein
MEIVAARAREEAADSIQLKAGLKEACMQLRVPRKEDLYRRGLR